MAKTVSVIIPVYKAEHYLQACLESLKAQTHQDLEVWMVEDGSPDRSGEICDAYARADSRFHVLHQENRGASAARNEGIRHATGEYISFIDSDDWVEPDFYEKLTALVEDGAVMGMCCYCLSDGKPCLPMGRKEALHLEAEEALRFVITDKMSGPCNKLFLRSRIRERKLLFDPELSVGEDMLFVYEYLKGGAMRFIPEPLYHYRQSEGSVSRSDFRPSRMTLFTAIDRMAGEVPEDNGPVRQAIRGKEAYCAFVSLLLLNTSGEKPENEQEIAKELRRRLRASLGSFLGCPGYSAAEKAAVTLVAASPRVGTALYKMMFMEKIQHR